MDFNPNKKPTKIEWATYIPDRTPQFKTHKRLSDCKNAIQYRSNMIIYHWEDDEWVEKFRIENWDYSDTCDWCGVSLFKESLYAPGEYRRYGHRGWVKHKDPTEFELVCLCDDCETLRYHGEKRGKEILARRKGLKSV